MLLPPKAGAASEAVEGWEARGRFRDGVLGIGEEEGEGLAAGDGLTFSRGVVDARVRVVLLGLMLEVLERRAGFLK